MAKYVPAQSPIGSKDTVLAEFIQRELRRVSQAYITSEQASAISRELLVRSISSTGAVLLTDDVITVSASGGPVTVSLPAIATSHKRRLWVKKIDASANAVTIDGNSSETIDGAATRSTTTQYAAWQLVAGATEWHII